MHHFCRDIHKYYKMRERSFLNLFYGWFGYQIVNDYFALLFMRKSRKTFTGFQLASAVFMIAALLWLTISAPFVYAGQQELAKQEKGISATVPLSSTEEESSNPFGNTTEEKAPTGGNSFSEEYIHDHHKHDHFFSIILRHYKCENAGTYIAFHGELDVPPPDAA
jgi:hypothetical protein